MALERSTFKVGGVTFPLTAALTNTLLKDGDPFIYYALAYFSSVLQTHLGSRWTAATAAAGLTALGNSVVAHAVPFDPEPYLASGQFKFPLLACYRVQERYTEKSVAYHACVCDLELAWVLPPLTAGQAEKLLPILNLVARVLRDRLVEGADAGYLSGARVWPLAGTSEVSISQARYGLYAAADGQRFPSVSMTLEVEELKQTVTGAFDEIVDARTAIDLVNEGETTVTDFVEVYTEDLDA